MSSGLRGHASKETNVRAKEKVIERPALYTHRTVAAMLDVSTATLRGWVHVGEFPKPHSIVRTMWFYPAATIDHYIKTGAWPDGVKFRDGRDRG